MSLSWKPTQYRLAQCAYSCGKGYGILWEGGVESWKVAYRYLKGVIFWEGGVTGAKFLLGICVKRLLCWCEGERKENKKLAGEREPILTTW